MLTPKLFQKALLNWFNEHGRKHLPWQLTKTPYQVWVSEIMLQQTQVSTVIPYFTRFMQKFPDVSSLAKAHEDEVLHLWAGLGYYNRARYILKTSKIIADQYAGHFPSTQSELETLPGIGKSTAGAILALAFGQSAVILDGNVKRVLSRVHGITEPINEKEIEKKLWQLAAYYTPTERVADYTQAMMDLGATLCVPSKPRCDECFLTKHCIAYQNNMATLLPKKKRLAEKPSKRTTFLILKSQNTVYLYKRPQDGIWGGLWSLPELSGVPKKKTVKDFCHDKLQIWFDHYEELTSFRHTFTHFHLHIFPILLNVQVIAKNLNMQNLDATQQIWYNLQEPQPIGLPKPIKNIMSALL